MVDLLVRYFHFIAFIVMYAALSTQHTLLRPSIQFAQLRTLKILDATYGITALVTLACGLLLWFSVGKPAAFYTPNPIFHTKVTLFIITGLISIMPTLFFLKKRTANNAEIQIPKRIIMCVRVQLTFLTIIPLLAVLMANGVGLKN